MEDKIDPALYAITTGEGVKVRVKEPYRLAGVHPAPGEIVEIEVVLQIINSGEGLK